MCSRLSQSSHFFSLNVDDEYFFGSDVAHVVSNSGYIKVTVFGLSEKVDRQGAI